MDIPDPRYAKTTDGASIAYQMLGSGRHDIVYLPGNATQLDVMWEHPAFAGFRTQLAELGRLIMIDRRGVGLSDRVAPEDLPPVEVLIDDLLRVLDTVGSLDTVLLGCDEGALYAVLAAAAYPERISRLVLWAPRPSMVATERHPWGGSLDDWSDWLNWAAVHWGSRESIVHDMHESMPSLLEDRAAIVFGAKVQRAAASPSAAVGLFRISMQLNVADVLPTIRIPTLVVHRKDDVFVPSNAGRAVAELIPDATFVELDGEDHFLEAGDTEGFFEPLRSFLRVEVPRADRSRRLATVLFTDIVGSTARAAQLGDAEWKHVLGSHHAVVRTELDRFGGHEVDTAGDGFFATFEGPATATRCAQAIASAVRELGLEIRAGVHTGEVETLDGHESGMGVVIGARIGALAGPSEVLVSSTVRDLTAGSGLMYEEAGEHELKGIPDRWRLYRVKN
jgi:class 3 adenylate cyclase